MFVKIRVFWVEWNIDMMAIAFIIIDYFLRDMTDKRILILRGVTTFACCSTMYG